MARIISLVNQAGGVGKTTLTANIGFHLAERGGRVLLLDMDSQASLTRQLGYNPRALEKVIAHSIVAKEPLHILAHELYQVDLVPSNKQLVIVDHKLAQEPRKEIRLKESIQKVRQNYDFILIDCPPSLGLLSVMSLVASTHVLIPIKACDKALEGAEDLGETLEQVLTRVNRRLRIAGAIPMMFDKRKVIHRTTYEEIKNSFKKYEVHPPITESTEFEKSWRARIPLAKLVPNHPAVQSLAAIAAYLEQCN